MGKLYFFVLCLLPVFAVSCDTASEKTIAPSSVPLADPNILLYDGVYYAYTPIPTTRSASIPRATYAPGKRRTRRYPPTGCGASIFSGLRKSII